MSVTDFLFTHHLSCTETQITSLMVSPNKVDKDDVQSLILHTLRIDPILIWETSNEREQKTQHADNINPTITKHNK